MGAMYWLPISDIAVTVAQDLYEVLAPSNGGFRPVRIDITTDQTTTQKLRGTLKLVTGSPTSGSGGGTITPVPESKFYGSSGLTVERNNTTRISGGTITIGQDFYFEKALSGIYVVAKEIEGLQVGPSERLVVGLETAPAASTKFCANLLVEMFG